MMLPKSGKDIGAPSGWEPVRLGDLLLGIEAGKSFTCESRPAEDGEWGVIKVSAMTWGAFDEAENKAVPKTKRFDPKNEIKKGDILLSRSNTAGLVGATVLVGECRPRLLLSDKSMRLIYSRCLSPQWLQRMLSAPQVRSQISAMATGTSDSMRNVSQDKIRSIKILLPPRNEQKRIASKIDELFSEIEEGERALEQTRKLVERYRQSVLKAAVTGELTREWREKYEGQFESGEALLARIATARREAWERGELAKMKAKGLKPTNDSWRNKYKEPASPDTSDLPELPKGWIWATVEQIGIVQLGRQRSPEKTKGRNAQKYIRAANITIDGIDFGNVYQMDFDEVEQATFRLNPGDLLLTEASGSSEHVGRPAIWPEVEGLYCFQNTVIRVTPCVISSDFMFALFKAAQDLGEFQKLAGGVGINHLSAGKLASYAMPVPPLVEQHRIVERVGKMLECVNQLSDVATKEFRRASALRQTVLQSGFSGRLVTQNSSDERASVLLARISAQSKEHRGTPVLGKHRDRKASE